MKKVKIKPANDNKLYDPSRGDFIPERGRDVVYSQYWMRRIRDGGAEIIESETKESNA